MTNLNYFALPVPKLETLLNLYRHTPLVPPPPRLCIFFRFADASPCTYSVPLQKFMNIYLKLFDKSYLMSKTPISQCWKSGKLIVDPDAETDQSQNIVDCLLTRGIPLPNNL